jgi:ABC-type bacteriocin/lantibiotic exporter with double-glycine peptidase domain
VLLLDEPTSALDSVSAQAVGSSLDAALAGQSALVIAHDARVVRRADRVLVLGDGVIRTARTNTYFCLAGKQFIANASKEKGFDKPSPSRFS